MFLYWKFHEIGLLYSLVSFSFNQFVSRDYLLFQALGKLTFHISGLKISSLYGILSPFLIQKNSQLSRSHQMLRPPSALSSSHPLWKSTPLTLSLAASDHGFFAPCLQYLCVIFFLDVIPPLPKCLPQGLSLKCSYTFVKSMSIEHYCSCLSHIHTRQIRQS